MHTHATHACAPMPQVQMAEDIDFKYPMKRACAWEISSFCKHVPHGHARIIRCLQKNLDNEDMSKWVGDAGLGVGWGVGAGK